MALAALTIMVIWILIKMALWIIFITLKRLCKNISRENINSEEKSSLKNDSLKEETQTSTN